MVSGDDVLIAGKFAGPTTTQRNPLLIDGATGEVLRRYNSPALKSVLAARIWAGSMAEG